MKRVAITLAVLMASCCGAEESSPEDPATRSAPYFETCAPIGLTQENAFVSEAVTTNPLPDSSAWKTKVPSVTWQGHPDVEAMFAACWRMVGEKLHRPEPTTNFKRNYVYTPFGKSVFVWGSCFITMYGQYAANVFPFIEQLDNFYAVQRADGFIPRQLGIYDGRSQFAPDDPSSVGGVIFAWAELSWFRRFGDIERLKKVYPVLLAHHRWNMKYRTWKDGTYFSSGWGCGMDNVPRLGTVPDEVWHHAFDTGHLSFVDVTLQQVFDAKNLIEMARLIGREPDASLVAEVENLTRIANEKMWDEEAGNYKDLDRDGNRVHCSHIGGFWALLAGVANDHQCRRLLASVEDPETFAAPCGTRSTARTMPGYEPDGGNYWRGGVWAITDYMVVKGLDAAGEKAAAHRLSKRQVEAFAKVFVDTGTVWESYDPELVTHGKLYGKPVRRDFVGFSGVSPISLLIEDVFGISVEDGVVKVEPRLTEAYSVKNLPLGDGRFASVEVEARESPDEKPTVRISYCRRDVPIASNEEAGL